MLILSRRPGESVRIGDHITVTICRIRGNQVRLGIQVDGGKTVNIARSELLQALAEEDPDHDPQT